MNDGEFLFRQTERETKRIARGSYNKKCGSKSRKCSLPSDRMTKGEWKRMNGPLKSFNPASMKKEYRWDVFTAMPLDIQKTYLQNLVENHGARVRDIADYLGTSAGNMSNFLWRKKIKLNTNQTRKPSLAWLDFLKADGVEEPEPVEENPVINDVPVVEAVVEEPKPTPTLDTEFKVENICYRAVGDPLVIFAQIAKLIEPGSRYRVNVDIWELKDMAPDAIPF